MVNAMKMVFMVFLLAALLVLSAGARTDKQFTLPDKAVQVAPGLYKLGTFVHEGKAVEGYAFVRYAKPQAKPRPGSTSCYSFLAKGAKWKAIEPYMIDVTGSGLESSSVNSIVSSGIQKWEDAADGTQGAGIKDIMGNLFFGASDGADENSPDGKNEVEFSSIADNNAIAVTIVWGVFSGPAAGRMLAEWDQVYDTDYAWSLSGEAGKMDFENIATHELGHSFGLGDLYTSGCSQETMYGYADYGETFKRSLSGGDIAGISELYK